MTTSAAAAGRNRPLLGRAHVAWPAVVALNAVLGCLGALPLGLLWTFLVNYPLAALGWGVADPTVTDDGAGVHIALLCATIVPGSLVCYWANRALGRAAGLRARYVAPVAACAFLVPVTVMFLRPELSTSVL